MKRLAPKMVTIIYNIKQAWQVVYSIIVVCVNNVYLCYSLWEQKVSSLQCPISSPAYSDMDGGEKYLLPFTVSFPSL